jgi:hypothetical protein
MSGRLTPVAATLIRSSPSLGCGTGRVVGTSASGPPGFLISTQVIVAGSALMVGLSERWEQW